MLDEQAQLEAIKRHFVEDHFAATTGIRVLELQRGYARAALTVEDRHLNSAGILQGGAIFTLADFAFAMACNSGGRLAVAINTNLSFLKATRSGTLIAEATEVARSRKISTCTVRVLDEAEELVALFQGTAYITSEPFPPTASPL